MTTRTAPRRHRYVSSSVLRTIFGSETRAKLLTHFLLHPGEAFHVRELERLLNEPAGNLLRDLRRFRAIHLLEVERIGNQVRYSLDSKHPLFEDLQRLVVRTVAADIVLMEALRPLKGIELALLYGSFVKGEATTRSDLDVMIIGDVSDQALASAFARAERTLGREVSYTRYTRAEARKRARQQDSFVQRVLAGPRIVFLGSPEDELLQLARR